jgi:hypothetical protein
MYSTAIKEKVRRTVLEHIAEIGREEEKRTEMQDTKVPRGMVGS